MSTIKQEDINRRKITIGLVGFGVVGKGLHDVLQSTPGLQASIKKICIKHADKLRALDSSYFTTDVNELLNDESINVIAELIDDADAAFEIVKSAIKKGKDVVSANKKMIAAHFDELLQLQQKYNVAFLYEASCCAGIPIIRNLEEYYDNDMLTQVTGIINGSTNFILTKIAEEGLSFAAALKIAQEQGFAESDPSLDIEGHDPANKLAILSAHAFGSVISPKDILYTGITAISERDAQYAAEKGYSIKLVAHAKKINEKDLAVFILPQFVSKNNELYNVKNEFNALETESCFADKHFFKGKGAGAFPTAAAVLSDIAALRYNYKYEYKKIRQSSGLRPAQNYSLYVSVSADDKKKIDLTAFSKINQSHNEDGYRRITGIIKASVLKNSTWWTQTGVSLILSEKCFLADPKPAKTNRKKRLELV